MATRKAWLGCMCPLFCQKKVKGKTKQNTHRFWKAGVGLCADVSSLARDLTWSSDFRCVHELWLHVGNSPFPHTAHGAGIFKLSIPRCAPVSFASGCCLYCLDYLHFHCSWAHGQHMCHLAWSAAGFQMSQPVCRSIFWDDSNTICRISP